MFFLRSYLKLYCVNLLRTLSLAGAKRKNFYSYRFKRQVPRWRKYKGTRDELSTKNLVVPVTPIVAHAELSSKVSRLNFPRNRLNPLSIHPVIILTEEGGASAVEGRKKSRTGTINRPQCLHIPARAGK